MIPAQQDKFGAALTVFYFDLNENRVPSRYENHMPMKVDDIVRELEAGKSFVVAKERAGAPPSLLIAAPRRAMLAEVEDKLATLTELPTEPLYIDVPVELRREEIQGTIRAQWFPHARACYEAALRCDASHVEANLNLAGILEEENRSEAALSHYKAALRADPLRTDAHLASALLYEKLGVRRRAREHWRRYLQCAPAGAWAEIAKKRVDEAE
jgi:tetratricopeptide (TPR) repeat protein